MTHPYRISPEGDAALLVSFGTQVRDDLMARARRAAEAIVAARLPEVTDVVGGYASVLVAYDPLRADYAQMEAAVAACLARPEARASRRPRLVTIPVCYGGDLGPDIQDVAHAAGMDVDEVVRRHAGVTYVVCMVGFLPGFPYLAGLDPRLATPRLPEPRTEVPAGAVGIGGAQTGVYPVASPGGWRLIGRTPARLFDPAAERPVAYRAGDRVRFQPIDRAAYERLAPAGAGLRVDALGDGGCR